MILHPQDIWSYDRYQQQRQDVKATMMALKQQRRLGVGPYAMVYFENRATMWYQIQEMLHIEKGGEAQLQDELAAYNPLIPQGSDLRATMMLEVPDPTLRHQLLHQWAGIEHTFTLRWGEHTFSTAVPLEEESRTTPEGKTSAVHFLRWDFSPESRDALRKALEDHTLPLSMAVTHPLYNHQVNLGAALRQALVKDVS